MKKYQRPLISTIEIPERTAYACNINGATGCPGISNLVGQGICNEATNGIDIPGIGNFGQCA
jgi:hypothetical protein